jgi:hypothetical protein
MGKKSNAATSIAAARRFSPLLYVAENASAPAEIEKADRPNIG